MHMFRQFYDWDIEVKCSIDSLIKPLTKVRPEFFITPGSGMCIFYKFSPGALLKGGARQEHRVRLSKKNLITECLVCSYSENKLFQYKCCDDAFH